MKHRSLFDVGSVIRMGNRVSTNHPNGARLQERASRRDEFAPHESK